MMRRPAAFVAALALGWLVAVPPAAAAPPTAASSPPPPSAAPQDTEPSPQGGEKMLAGGIALTSVGAALAVLIGVPSLLLRERARDNAASATYEARQRRYAGRAERRENFAVASLGVGGAFMLIGIPLMIVGGQRVNQAQQRAIVTPVLSPTMAGLSTRLRF